MTSAERLNTALHHREPDRVPLDLGGVVTGITLKAHRALCSFLGIPCEDILVDRIQYLVQPAEDILEHFAIDTRYVYDPVPRKVWLADQEGSLWEDSLGDPAPLHRILFRHGRPSPRPHHLFGRTEAL